MLILWYEGDSDLDERVHQEIGGPSGQGGYAVVELHWRQAEQETEREHDEGRPVEAGGQQYDPAAGEKSAGP